MIYFDNAATTLIKPKQVYNKMMFTALRSGNPGRGGHRPSSFAADTVYNCRVEIAELFSIEEPERVIFTQNATHSLNIAIKSILHNGGKALVSTYEHNSVIRPLEALSECGGKYEVVKTKPFDSNDAAKMFDENIKKRNPDCVIINHISNVFGNELPIFKIDSLCEKYNIPMIIDASQSAGCADIDAEKLKSTAYICMPGHKGLYGPQGTGVLLCCNDKYLYSIIQGGTGSISSEFHQPNFLPDVFESGTLNVPGIGGLCEGVKFIKRLGLSNVQAKHRDLLNYAKTRLEQIREITLITGAEHNHGVLSFDTKNIDCEELCYLMSKEGICLRGGLHCSPLAHTVSGTENRGLTRMSFSVFNSTKEIDTFALKIQKILSQKTSVFY